MSPLCPRGVSLTQCHGPEATVIVTVLVYVPADVSGGTLIFTVGESVTCPPSERLYAER